MPDPLAKAIGNAARSLWNADARGVLGRDEVSTGTSGVLAVGLIVVAVGGVICVSGSPPIRIGWWRTATHKEVRWLGASIAFLGLGEVCRSIDILAFGCLATSLVLFGLAVFERWHTSQ